MLWLLLACATAKPDACPAVTDTSTDAPTLFGTPNDATGLDADQCAPTCPGCPEAWTQPTYTDEDLTRWRAYELLDAPAVPTEDPYAAGEPMPVEDDAVCAFEGAGGVAYRLRGYESAEAAEQAGGQVTHFGVCGACSSLQDLAVYAANPDLTAPVRDCGLQHFSGSVEELSACIEALGFTAPCARVWAYNTRHTQAACLAVCTANLDAPYNNPDGSLNDCLQCDEDESGAVFKAYAGRTRRNTGLASSMCRPCEEVRPLEHGY